MYDNDYSSNAPCDNTGYCAGTSCPYYFTVCHTTKEEKTYDTREERTFEKT